MPNDIALFYYYSTPTLPENCYLNLSKDIAYRNMFLLHCDRKLVHFEFPVFEDHSYNTICNKDGLRDLIKRPTTNDKYIIFRTRNHTTKQCNIIGYYKIKKSYYQETNKFNNNGFVWGIEAEAHLLYKNQLPFNKIIRRGYRRTWGENHMWEYELNRLLEEISKRNNVADEYQKETNKIINIFNDSNMICEWRESCVKCEDKKHCKVYREYNKYKLKTNGSDMYDVLHHIYKNNNENNIYSRNVLIKYPKIYLK